MENTKTIKLTKEQIDSLAFGLSSKRRNFKLKEKTKLHHSLVWVLDECVYLESKNFKIEKLKRNGELNR